MRRGVILGCAAALLLGGGATAGVVERDRLHDAWAGGEVVAATTTVMTLDVPEGWRPSPGRGACVDVLGPVRCLWAPDGPRQALDTLTAALAQEGLDLGPTACSEDEHRGVVVCEASTEVRGVRLVAVAQDTVPHSDVPRGATGVGVEWRTSSERLQARGYRAAGLPEGPAGVLGAEDADELLPVRLQGLSCLSSRDGYCIEAEGRGVPLEDVERLVADLTEADWQVTSVPDSSEPGQAVLARRMAGADRGNLLALSVGPDRIRVIFA